MVGCRAMRLLLKFEADVCTSAWSSAGTDVELRLAQARRDRRSCAEALEVSGENVDNIRNLAKSVMATGVPCDAECFDYSK